MRNISLFLVIVLLIIFFLLGFLASNFYKKTDNEINVLDYEKMVVNNDWQPAIQQAIEDAYREKKFCVLIPKELTIKSSIKMKPGITLRGKASPGFYNGLHWISDQNKKVAAPKIKAGKLMNGPLIEYNNPINNKGITIENLILDGNKLVDNVFYAHSDRLLEANINLENLGVQGALFDGIRLEKVLTTKINNSNISANGNFGINFNVGASDSVLSENYIHGNQKGGIRMSAGSHYNQVISGKIEDNYGSGILLDGSNGGSSNHIINSIAFHVNNGPAIKAVNGANAIINSSQISKNGVSELNEFSSNILAIGAETFLQVSNSHFTIGEKTNYNATSLDYSKLLISDSTFKKQFDFYGKIISNDNLILN